MDEGIKLVLIYLVISLLVGGAFLVVAAVIFGNAIPDETDNAGAEEGDIRSFRHDVDSLDKERF